MTERIIEQEIAELKDKVLEMGVMVQGLISLAVESLKNLDGKLAEKVIEEDEKVDKLELEIDEKCVNMIALRQPEASDLRFIMAASRISNDLERIGDLAEDIAGRTRQLAGQPLIKPLIDIPRMSQLCQDALKLVLEAFIDRDAAKARSIWTIEHQVDQLRDQVNDELIEIMKNDAAAIQRALPLLLASRHLERICDHATNIAEDIVYMVEARVVKHGG